MEENMNEIPQRSSRPRRRKRSKMQIFKESYLPVIIAGAALMMVIIFIVGSVSRGISRRKAERDASIAAASEEAERQAMLREQADRLLVEAEHLADAYDYQSAIQLLEGFQGDYKDFPDIAQEIDIYKEILREMIPWDNLAEVPNLAFNMLIADPARAYTDEEYGSSYRKNFITIGEFAQILQQLYDNGYVLVSVRDFVDVSTDANGKTVYSPKTLYLPKDKKPFILTQTGVNYNIYMVDGDGDNLPDKDGAGFASKLVRTAEGSFSTEMVDAQGNLSTGSYDLVPILEDFLQKHPDFSIRGARAILAVSGYNGVFGYRINSKAKDMFGEEAYNADRLAAAEIVKALKDTGYDIACYTYGQTSYATATTEMIQKDQKAWMEEIVPVIGKTDMMVYFKVSDIGDTTPYAGEKYDALSAAGFRFYFGATESNEPWAQITGDYVRQNRILVTGSELVSEQQQFAGMFDAASVLDPARS